MIIDSHQHFWRYSAAEYAWIGETMKGIRRDFLPTDLGRELAAAAVDGAVSVQARQTTAETQWLLDLAAENTIIRGVVGWLRLADEAALDADLQRFARHPKLKGVRHVVQDEPDDAFILGSAFNRGVSRLAEFHLVYDILITARHLPNAMRFVDRHPGQRFVVDHIAKPGIRHNLLEPWRTQLREMARRPNVWCKLSGVVTEADLSAWTPAQVRPFMDAALDAFGPSRLLFGSDWPVCLAACGYGRWLGLVRELIAALQPHEQAAILGGNAAQVYRLA